MRARAPVILLTLLASFLVPILIGNVYASSCPPGNCQVTVSSNVPSADGTIWIKIDNGTGSYCSSNQCTVALPQVSPPTFDFPYNTTHTLTVLSANLTFTGASTAGRYVWKEWANYYGTTSPGTRVWTTNPTVRICPANQCVPTGIVYNYTGTAGLTAVFDKQYPATLSFTDVQGNPLSPSPISLTLQGQAIGTTTITGYSGQYVSADMYTITSALWEGTNIPTNSTETLDLTNAPATATISLKAFPETVQIVDNNNSPVSGANVTVTFVNGTIASKTYLSDNTGKVHLGDIPYPGSFGLTVHYQNQMYGPYSPSAADSPTYTVQVNAGSTTSTTTTAVVLLVIFGIAFFLILLAIKVRRPAAPPRI